VQKYALFGGSYDPVHSGHLLLATFAREQLGLERVYFIPAALGPHRQSAPRAEGAHRLAMLQLALEGEGAFLVDDLELRRGGVSYTMDTVLRFRELLGAEPVLLVGADNMGELHTWHRIDELVKLARFAYAPRPGEEVIPEKLPAGVRVERLEMPLFGVSSTLVRERAAAGLSLRGLVPDAVARYIEEKRLYRDR
ncbi:MAG TPA: nicotinate (nicotinamide) nucleotide adenylyltransferase, partial [Candidatus Coatesbacteria bacterium]|nr:nicotinate (nicotinamide) nucleotide adenylyltransferase [Candidatus Coatesbacteria bacterium]